MTLLLVLIGLFSCIQTQENEPPTGEFYYTAARGSGPLEIVKVRDCEYVLWHNGYGSDMEHYADCSNPAHKKE